MAPFNRILLCYDATPEGRLALRCGAALAQQLQTETHLLSIFGFVSKICGRVLAQEVCQVRDIARVPSF
jgi:hypothetical protein